MPSETPPQPPEQPQGRAPGQAAPEQVTHLPHLPGHLQGQPPDWLQPQWVHAVPSVRAVMTSRQQPCSTPPAESGPYASFNLGDHVGDDPAAVERRRQEFAQLMHARPVWLKQVHGARVVHLAHGSRGEPLMVDGQPWDGQPIEADGAWTADAALACTVMVADCLPVLLAAPEGLGVAALHAGWRGLCGAGPGMAGRGVVDAGVAALCAGTGCDPAQLQAWLGPCIGPQAFEVGPDVLEAFGVALGLAWEPGARFKPVPGQADHQTGCQTEHQTERKWWADLPALAQDRLRAAGVQHIAGGHWCTVADASGGSAPRSRFYSYRRDGVTGRQAASIWLVPQCG